MAKKTTPPAIIIPKVKGITAQELALQIATIIQQNPKSSLPNNEKLMTRKEVAKLCDVSLVTLHNWNKKGLLVPYRIGGLVRYKQSEVFMFFKHGPNPIS